MTSTNTVSPESIFVPSCQAMNTPTAMVAVNPNSRPYTLRKIDHGIPRKRMSKTGSWNMIDSPKSWYRMMSRSHS
ncbi:hypothetical protein ACFQL4_13230 [Halosimplex aquaticum]